MKIRKGDNVKVISGKDKGKTGKVAKVFLNEDRILVEGVNMRKKHKKTRQHGKKGETVHLAAPVHISNVMIVCPKCGASTRMGYAFTEAGEKMRVCKQCGSEI